MKYIVNTSNDPAYNIALEAYAFRELVNEDELFILWINRPAIIVGKHQNTIQEINKEYTDAHDIKVVRRLSGGGAVYHDLKTSIILSSLIRQMKAHLTLRLFLNR